MCLGIPAQVLAVGDLTTPFSMGEVSMAGETRSCCFAYLPEIAIS